MIIFILNSILFLTSYQASTFSRSKNTVGMQLTLKNVFWRSEYEVGRNLRKPKGGSHTYTHTHTHTHTHTFSLESFLLTSIHGTTSSTRTGTKILPFEHVAAETIIHHPHGGDNAWSTTYISSIQVGCISFTMFPCGAIDSRSVSFRRWRYIPSHMILWLHLLTT